ncbi:MAG TPA: NAD(P)H-dependent oxidoreductase [Candidatus Norongarragalinales archaeon]|nr:NAD(P)H-dependent oxidoreductase [Candidatus Norongarragalinales archaeon]
MPISLKEETYSALEAKGVKSSILPADLMEAIFDFKPAEHIKAVGISTSTRPEYGGKFSHSKVILSEVMGHLGDRGAETQLIDAKTLNLYECAGYYSRGQTECIFPCKTSIARKDDQMKMIYRALLESDVVIWATPIRWGMYSALIKKIIERMNCIENMQSVFGMNLIENKVAGFVTIGHEDGAQNTAGLLAMTMSAMGWNIPPHCMCYFVGGADEQTELDDERIANNQVHELAEVLADTTFNLAQKLTGKTKKFAKP